MSLFSKLNTKLDAIAVTQEAKKEANQNLSDIIDEKTKSTLRVLTGRDVLDTRQHPDNVYSFISSSGGAGTTTVIANVATALKKKGVSVIVIDANILNPMIQNSLQCKHKPKEQGDIVSFLMGERPLGECIWFNKSEVALLAPFDRTIEDIIRFDTEQVAQSTETLLRTLKELFDVVLIDIPTEGIIYNFINMLLYKTDVIFSVWDENIGCIQGTEMMRKNMETSGIHSSAKLTQLIFNKRTNIHYPTHCITDLGLTPIVVLPYEAGIIDASFSGQVFITQGKAKSSFAKAYCKGINNLADIILEINKKSIHLEKEAIDEPETEAETTVLEL